MLGAAGAGCRKPQAPWGRLVPALGEGAGLGSRAGPGWVTIPM